MKEKEKENTIKGEVKVLRGEVRGVMLKIGQYLGKRNDGLCPSQHLEYQCIARHWASGFPTLTLKMVLTTANLPSRKTYINILFSPFITLFISILVLCWTNNVSHIHSEGGNIYSVILSVPHNDVMDMNYGMFLHNVVSFKCLSLFMNMHCIL